MATGESTNALLKRLRKAEQAHGRLGELAKRIQTQADTIADLIRLANGLIVGRAAASRAPGLASSSSRTVGSRTRKPASVKPSTAPGKSSTPSPKAVSTPRKASVPRRATSRAVAQSAAGARKAAPRPRTRRPVADHPEPITTTTPGIVEGPSI